MQINITQKHPFQVTSTALPSLNLAISEACSTYPIKNFMAIADFKILASLPITSMRQQQFSPLYHVRTRSTMAEELEIN
jgi:hypothetical protein